MVGLSREVGGDVVVLVLLEGGVAQVAPEDGGEAHLVGHLEGLAHLHDLTPRLGRAEVDGGSHRRRSHVARLLHAREQDLVELVRVGQELVVVDLEDEGDPVGVLASHRGQHAQGRGHGVAAALHCEGHDALGIEAHGVLGEGRARRVLDALVHGQDREVARPRQAAVAEQRLQVAEHGQRAVGGAEDPIHEVGAGKMKVGLRDALAGVVEESPRVGSQQPFDVLDRVHCGLLN